MTSYAYRIYRKNNLNNPIIGGGIHADNMEQAAQKIIKHNKIEVVHEYHCGFEYHSFTYKGEKVGILIYLNPEDF